jgi:hypothetical protein
MSDNLEHKDQFTSGTFTISTDDGFMNKVTVKGRHCKESDKEITLSIHELADLKTMIDEFMEKREKWMKDEL